MKFRLLAAFPFGFAALFALVAFGGGEGALTWVLGAENEAGKVAALVGCFAAALAFGSGDYLRRAWFYSGLCYLLLVAADVVGMPFVTSHLSSHAVELTQGALVIIANATSVAGTWMLAHAWSVAGLDEGSRGTRRGLLAGAIVLSLAITGWSLLYDVRALAAGDLGALVSIASDLGDTICLALVAPLMHTALAMRGGVLRWPWGLITSSGLAWLVYDASSAIRVEHPGWLVLSEGFRALACAAVLSAGIAQRLAVAPDTRSAG